MPATGFLKIRAYTSTAEFPLADAAVVVTAEDGTVIAMMLTDRSGRTKMLELPVPDKIESQRPDPEEQPFLNVNLHIRLHGYEQIIARNIQIFPGTVTDQDFEMIPLSELPGQWDQTVEYDTPPQNL